MKSAEKFSLHRLISLKKVLFRLFFRLCYMNNNLVKRLSGLHLGDLDASRDKLETVNEPHEATPSNTQLQSLLKANKARSIFGSYMKTPGIVYARTHA